MGRSYKAWSNGRRGGASTSAKRAIRAMNEADAAEARQAKLMRQYGANVRWGKGDTVTLPNGKQAVISGVSIEQGGAISFGTTEQTLWHPFRVFSQDDLLKCNPDPCAVPVMAIVLYESKLPILHPDMSPTGNISPVATDTTTAIVPYIPPAPVDVLPTCNTTRSIPTLAPSSAARAGMVYSYAQIAHLLPTCNTVADTQQATDVSPIGDTSPPKIVEQPVYVPTLPFSVRISSIYSDPTDPTVIQCADVIQQKLRECGKWNGQGELVLFRPEFNYNKAPMEFSQGTDYAIYTHRVNELSDPAYAAHTGNLQEPEQVIGIEQRDGRDEREWQKRADLHSLAPHDVLTPPLKADGDPVYERNMWVHHNVTGEIGRVRFVYDERGVNVTCHGQPLLSWWSFKNIRPATAIEVAILQTPSPFRKKARR